MVVGNSYIYIYNKCKWTKPYKSETKIVTLAEKKNKIQSYAT